MSFLLVSVAGLIIAAVMLRSSIFSKATAYVGILANVIGLSYYITLVFAPAIAFPSRIRLRPFFVDMVHPAWSKALPAKVGRLERRGESELMQIWVHYLIGVLAAFVALTAIGGGIAMLVGADRFPVEWLRNTPFSDYTIPALALAIVVGGSSLIAAVTVFTGREVGVLASMAAGLIMAGWIVVEVVTINAPKPSWIEGVYFALGLALFGLATYLWIG